MLMIILTSQYPLIYTINESIYFFSWDEVGTHDIPAFTDYILEVTNKRKVFYIGHSSGSTSYLAFAAERPEYNEKIHLAVLMAPSAILTNPIPGIVPLNNLFVLAKVRRTFLIL